MNTCIEGNSVVKTLSQTHWSAHADATGATSASYTGIRLALETIQQTVTEKSETRSEAEGLVNKMQRLEYGILTELWATVLECFSRTGLVLQSPTLDLNNSVDLLKSLYAYVLSRRDQYDFIEEYGKRRMNWIKHSIIEFCR